MSDSNHAFLAPSGSHIWGPGGCPYYPTMAAAYPSGESEHTREGNAAHEMLASELAGEEVMSTASSEMMEAVVMAAREVEKLRALSGSPGHVETGVKMPQVHPRQCWGTADWFDVNGPGNTVYVLDFKYGHRYVDPYENPQLVLYGLGALNHFGIVPDGAWDFVFVVVQPRAFHPDGPVKTWKCDGKRFMQLVAELRQAATDATRAEPVMRTGEHCNDCEGNIHCPAFQQVSGAALDVSRLGVPHEMGPAAVGTMRTYVASAIKRLQGMATGLDAEIERATRSGTTIPGWELKPGDTRRVWTVPVEEVKALGEMMGVELTKLAPITPTQAINAGIDGDVISAYSSKPPGSLKVAPSDKTAAAKAFS